MDIIIWIVLLAESLSIRCPGDQMLMCMMYNGVVSGQEKYISQFLYFQTLLETQWAQPLTHSFTYFCKLVQK